MREEQAFEQKGPISVFLFGERDGDAVKKDKGKEERKGRLIPEGELKCLWMEAGVVSYKLCDYEYECERCPFDQVLRTSAHESATRGKHSVEDAGLQKIPLEKDLPQELPAGSETVNFDRMFQGFYDIKMKGDFFYHPGHTWVDVESSHCAKIGLDDFAGKFLLGIKMVILPSVNLDIDRGQVCCWIVAEEGTLPIVAPLTGSVIAINRQISHKPSLVNRNPYEQGWLLKIEPEHLHQDLKYLYREDDILPRYKKDLERLRKKFETLLRKNWEKLGPTLCDGGDMLGHVRDMLGPRRYFDIIRAFFTGK